MKVFILFLFFASAVNADTVVTPETTIKAETKSTNTKVPSWVETLPVSTTHVFVVGEGLSENKDDALEKAWVSGLLRIGMTNFPELGTIHSQSNETLHDSNYQRQFTLQLNKLNWTGLKEVEGSPFVTTDDGKYAVYRLLKWSKTDIEVARKNIKKNLQYFIPDSPEITRRHEDELIDEERKIRDLNRKLTNRDAFVTRVIGEVKCGATVENLIAILGPPDRESSHNGMNLLPDEYYWGTFKVEHYRTEPIFSITAGNGVGETFILCNGTTNPFRMYSRPVGGKKTRNRTSRLVHKTSQMPQAAALEEPPGLAEYLRKP